MLRKECPSKIYKIRNRLVFRVSPERSELKGVAGLLSLALAVTFLADCANPSSIRVILRVSSVLDHENLYIFIQTAPSPEAIPLVAINLVKRLFECNSTTLQFNMDKREPIHQNCDIVAII